MKTLLLSFALGRRSLQVNEEGGTQDAPRTHQRYHYNRNNEDPAHLEKIQRILKPPAETGQWEGYTGCSRDLLDDAPGYLRELLTDRLGQAPPYTYPD